MKTLSAIKLQNYEKINDVEQAQMKGGIGWDTFFRGLVAGAVGGFPAALTSVAVEVIAGCLVDYFKSGKTDGYIELDNGNIRVKLPSNASIDSLIYRGPDGQQLGIYGYDSK